MVKKEEPDQPTPPGKAAKKQSEVAKMIDDLIESRITIDQAVEFAKTKFVAAGEGKPATERAEGAILGVDPSGVYPRHDTWEEVEEAYFNGRITEAQFDALADATEADGKKEKTAETPVKEPPSEPEPKPAE